MHIFDVKMAEGNKPTEDFVLITILANGDAIECVDSTVSLAIMLLSHSTSILTQSCSAIFLRLTSSQHVISCFYVLEMVGMTRDGYMYTLSIK